MFLNDLQNRLQPHACPSLKPALNSSFDDNIATTPETPEQSQHSESSPVKKKPKKQLIFHGVTSTELLRESTSAPMTNQINIDGSETSLAKNVCTSDVSIEADLANNVDINEKGNFYNYDNFFLNLITELYIHL